MNWRRAGGGSDPQGRVPGTAAAKEERAELEELRSRADRTAHEAARTLGELTERLAEARSPRLLARQATGRARQSAGRAFGRARAKTRESFDGQRGATHIALAAIPVVALLAVIAYRRMKS